MIEPTNALAFSMQANKGVYALLLGSGVSRAARIPTGWEVTIELVRKLAALQNASCEPDPAEWFRQSTGSEPDYSALLNAVAKMPAERQQLLRGYFEPTEEEQEEGAKAPTKAHKAIAELVKRGFIRVIVTTNFDRLTEIALQDVGIQPTVLSTADHIAGALPLVHTACTVIKVHGDYLDTRIRNTSEELASYPEALDRLLDRVLDEFGLVVAGWSADWDEALRNALIRAPSRRFSTYWAVRGETSAAATDLIKRRGATKITISDADSFFSSLVDQVIAVDDFARPHPLTTDAAVATLKRYLSEEKYRIALSDLVEREAEAVKGAMSDSAFNLGSQNVTGESTHSRLLAYEGRSVTLTKMAFTAGVWSESYQLAVWKRALARLVSNQTQTGVNFWLSLQRYPATLLLYAFGLGAVSVGNLNALGLLFNAPIAREHRDPIRALDYVSIWGMFDRGGEAMKILPGREREFTPLQNHMGKLFYPLFGHHFSNEQEFEFTFDRLEILAALHYARHLTEDGVNAERYWTLPGAYGWRRSNRDRIVADLRNDLASYGNASTLVTSGIAGNTAESALRNIAALEEFTPKLRWF